MRVADLGIDPSSRMIDVVVVFVEIIGIFGPLLFVRPWVKSLGKWIEGKPRLAKALAKVRRLHLGRLPVGRWITSSWVAWVLLSLVVLSITLLLTRTMTLIMVLFVGPAVAILLVANILELDDELPNLLRLPHLESWRVLGFLGLILVVFLLALGAEVLIRGPDLRTDGLHGILAPRVLGFKAIPVTEAFYLLPGLKEGDTLCVYATGAAGNLDPLESLQESLSTRRSQTKRLLRWRESWKGTEYCRPGRHDSGPSCHSHECSGRWRKRQSDCQVELPHIACPGRDAGECAETGAN